MQPAVKKHLKLYHTQLRKKIFRSSVLPSWRTFSDETASNSRNDLLSKALNVRKPPAADIPKKISQEDLSTIGGKDRASYPFGKQTVLSASFCPPRRLLLTLD
jgi:hypothetical protein